jgi:hypothetical protein
MKAPHEFKVLRVRECASASELIETPDQAAAYWRANIPGADWYDPAKEAFVVLVLNTRRRILGHNLVSLGSLDSCPVSPREVFRPVIIAAGSVKRLSARYSRLTFLLDYDREKERLKGLAKAGNGQVQHHQVHY